MVSPVRRREAVEMVEDRLEVSQRRACSTLGQHRSTQRYRPRRRESDAPLLAAIRRWARAEPRWGYRMVAGKLRQEGWAVNFKRVHRLWKQAGLHVPTKVRKRRSLGSRKHGASRLKATRRNHVWSYDFIFDQTSDGRRLKWLPLVDEFTKENLALEVDRRLESGDVIAVLDQAVEEYGAPEFIRSDNGPEFIAKKVCRWIQERGFQTAFIPPGAPWENPYIESFNSRLRHDLLDVEEVGSLAEAKWLAKDHRHKLRPAVWLRSGLRPPLRQTAKATPTTNQISHRTRSKKRGQVRGDPDKPARHRDPEKQYRWRPGLRPGWVVGDADAGCASVAREKPPPKSPRRSSKREGKRDPPLA
jgi:putative transposase